MDALCDDAKHKNNCLDALLYTIIEFSSMIISGALSNDKVYVLVHPSSCSSILEQYSLCILWLLIGNAHRARHLEIINNFITCRSHNTNTLHGLQLITAALDASEATAVAATFAFSELS